MEIGALETAFINWLNAEMPDLPTEAFPDNPAGYDLLSENGVVLVRYNGTTYGEVETLGMTTQTGETEFVLSVLAYSLSAASGVYANLSKVIRTVQGKTFPGATAVKLKNIAFAGVENGRWQYDMTVLLEMPEIEPAEQEPFNLFNQITIRNANDEVHL